MKFVVFCLLAVCCYSMATRTTASTDHQRRKLIEVRRQLAIVRTGKDMKPSQMVRTPPSNIEDCCSLSALDCFQESLKGQVNFTGPVRKLYNSLRLSLTRGALDFCVSRNVQPTCQECASNPLTTASEFFDRLDAFIQRGMANLPGN